MGGVDGLVVGLAVIALITVVSSATVGGVLYAGEIVDQVRRLVKTLWPPEAPPERPAIERIGCDARRLRRELRTLAPDIPMARRTGLQLAYDDVLVDACGALEVATTLTDLPLGPERDAERLYVEAKLDAAGLHLQV